MPVLVCMGITWLAVSEWLKHVDAVRPVTWHRAVLRSELRALDATHTEAQAVGLPDLFLVEHLYRRRMLDAELDFVSTLAKEIRTSNFPGTLEWRRLHELREQGLTFEQIMADPVTHLGEAARFLAPHDE